MARWAKLSPVEGEPAADRSPHACLVTDDAQYKAMIANHGDMLTPGESLTVARDLESGDPAEAATVNYTWDGRIELAKARLFRLRTLGLGTSLEVASSETTEPLPMQDVPEHR